MSVDGIEKIRVLDGRGKESEREREKEDGNMNQRPSNQRPPKAANANWLQPHTYLREVMCWQQGH